MSYHVSRDEDDVDDVDDGHSRLTLPEALPIRFTTHTFPLSAAVKDASGIPWGVSITPFTQQQATDAAMDSASTPMPSDLVARCSTCFAYINPYCVVSRRWWRCSLCGAHVSLRHAQPTVATGSDPERYRQPHPLQKVPELIHQVLDLELPFGPQETSSLHQYAAAEADRPPVYLALVDETGGAAFLSAVSQALQRVVSTLPDHHCFGLITFSDRVGIFDVAAPLPLVRFADIGAAATTADPSLEPGSAAVDLADVVSVADLACPVGGNRESMQRAAEALPSVCSGGLEYSAALRPRCTGAVLQRVLELLLGCRGAAAASAAPPDATPTGFEDGFEFAGCHVAVFLAGPVTAGIGSESQVLHTAAANEPPTAAAAAAAQRHYVALAAQAAPRGIAFSIWAAPQDDGADCGLADMAPLAMLTGGGLHHHPLTAEATHSHSSAAATPMTAAAAAGETAAVRRLVLAAAAQAAEAAAYAALLRVRCSTGFRVRQRGSRRSSSSSGGSVANSALFADPQLDSLWHLARCPANRSVTLDFEFDGVGELLSGSDEEARAPVVQVAFAYTEACGGGGGGGGSGGGSGGGGGAQTSRRRLRVVTVKCAASHDALEVADGASASAIAACLLPKAVHTMRTSGAAEAAALLQEWAINLCCSIVEAAAADAHASAHHDAQQQQLPTSAAAVARDPTIHLILQLTYGLLHVLADAAASSSSSGGGGGSVQLSDAAAAALHQLSALDPAMLRLTLYPVMRAFAADMSTALAAGLPLRRSSADASGPNPSSNPNGRTPCVLVVDALTRVHVHYAAEALRRALPSPPPRASLLGAWLSNRAAMAGVPPVEVELSSAATSQLNFQKLLLDDCAPTGMGVSGFADFLAQVVAGADAALAGQ
ncbi:hypothetical protein JKP88DRAFT_294468 [Tribonema minus]|uniref:Zinc finger Sec23/Sec24-type domain-containing protein n=1 Tax=Tribonema minus TaxID=303371 RepID=A0A835ZE54_9STRA|nr:hypothetical protein JKP88DRAFT_294468 [Tribonema minus]